MNWNNKKLTLLIALSLSFTSCVEKTTNKGSTSSTTTTQTSDVPSSTNPGTNNPNTTPEDPSLPNYYSLPPISVHGAGNPNRNPPPGGKFWASNRNISGNDQYIFLTDSRLNIRVKALSGGHAKYNDNGVPVDSNGFQCQYTPLAYTKLKVSICVRSSNGTCVNEHVFDDIQVGSNSLVKEFSVPANTSDPLVIEVKDVQWDYSCIEYATRGYPNYGPACPFTAVGYADCVKFQIEFSTDETKDLPGARY
jgi:hypothetical protein